MARKYHKKKRDNVAMILFDLPFILIKKLVGVIVKPLTRFFGYGKKGITSQGEKVKSNIEKRIANSLSKYNVNYKYEHPLRHHLFFKIYPDFYLPDQDIYIEYYGLLNHPEVGEKYKEEREYKRRIYKKKGIHLIELDHRHSEKIESHLWKAIGPYVDDRA